MRVRVCVIEGDGGGGEKVRLHLHNYTPYYRRSQPLCPFIVYSHSLTQEGANKPPVSTCSGVFKVYSLNRPQEGANSPSQHLFSMCLLCIITIGHKRAIIDLQSPLDCIASLARRLRFEGLNLTLPLGLPCISVVSEACLKRYRN